MVWGGAWLCASKQQCYLLASPHRLTIKNYCHDSAPSLDIIVVIPKNFQLYSIKNSERLKVENHRQWSRNGGCQTMSNFSLNTFVPILPFQGARTSRIENMKDLPRVCRVMTSWLQIIPWYFLMQKACFYHHLQGETLDFEARKWRHPKIQKPSKAVKNSAWNANVKHIEKSWIVNLANVFGSAVFLPWPHSQQESHRTSTRNQEGIAHESYRWQIVLERSSDDRDLYQVRKLRKSVLFIALWSDDFLHLPHRLLFETLCILFVCAWLLGTLARLTMQATDI